MYFQIRRLLIGCLLTAIFAAVACAQSQPSVTQAAPAAPIRALPLYEKCEALSDNASAPAAIAALKDKDTEKRIKAAASLAKACDARATNPLLAVARDDEEIAARVAAVEALGQLGDQQAIDSLIEMIESSDWRVRVALARTLTSFQVYRASNAVLNVLSNPGDKKVTEEGDLRARCQGILQVNQLRDVRFSRKAVGFLFLFLDHENQQFRRIAREAMQELKGTRNGYHELLGILKQANFPDFRVKAAYWLGKFNIEDTRSALEEVAASDRDSMVRQAAQDALAAMKKR
ncbi:MAG TPA: HEAT repeat domain-containing protein [Blastocatellia bacterium]|nr:HEAT repeat domain-containing protein [Blastocatellia bacterium]HMV86148.1 HEAT repeat domain-containing protein [Blastocatellia bacterium]HMX28755.1 HEAT repeat domain-containing protein [Blastocatellia bacterium]HMY75483.1 HEAT repeat domain-containing protein [Blastocatellia bacterium]HMZ18170.1 HEAT repeat domain-containing protein [Blastocatellia bacterium]